MISALDEDTRAVAGPDGVAEVELSDRWAIGGGRLNGGYQLVVALRALVGVMPLPDPVVVSASFLRPALVGPARVHTEVVRAGRRFGTGSARLVQADREVLRLEATFADLAATPADVVDTGDGATPPALPAPERCTPLGAAGPGLTVADRVRILYATEPGWYRGAPSGDASAESWFTFADGSDTELWALPFVVDGAAPVVLELGYGSSTVQLTVHLREHPAPGPLACRTVTRHLAHGLHEEDVDVWDARGVLVAQSRQLALVLPGEA